MTRIQRLGLVVLLGAILGTELSAQGPLSNQVLQLLTRQNSWTATNTFLDLRLARGVPSATTDRFVEDNAGNLYFNGQLVAGAGGGTSPHNFLSTSHADTVAHAAVRASVVVANASPLWAILTPTVTGQILEYNGTDTVWSLSGAALTSLNAGALSGTAAAFNGAAITALNASNLSSGTVPLAQLSGITNTQIASGAGIVYSKLSLTGGILNADVNASAAIAYSKLNLSGSVLTTDIAASTLLFANWASNSCTSSQVPQYTGSAWACRTLTTSDVSGAGTVTSVALTTPGIFSIAGSPVTTSGTLALSLATQSANLVWAGPGSGAAAGPTFRSLVNADFPTTGVSAGTYAKVTVNIQGLVTAAAAQASLTADVSGVLPMANGGTGVGVAADDTVLIGSGAAWVAQTLPDCPMGALGYTQASNLFSCTSTGGPTHNLLSATHPDTVAASPVRGDLIVANATPAWARVALGTAGQILAVGTVDPSWTNTFARGVITTSQPWTFTQTWNAGGVTFAGMVLNITNTASAAASKILDLQLAGTSQFSVDRAGNVNYLLSSSQAGVLLTTVTPPTISSGFGTTPGVLSNNGTATFRINVGTGGSATTGVVTMPQATTGWNCSITDFTTNIVTRETASSGTSVSVTAASAWTASDTLIFQCTGY